jgi:di/tricarboxylate transporter
LTDKKKKRPRAKLSEILTILFPIAVALLWIFSDKLGADPVILTVLSLLSVVLVISLILSKRQQRKLAAIKKAVDAAREQVGVQDGTDYKDKYYF